MKRREALKKTLLALGYTISAPSVISIFNSCNSNPSHTWKPQFFSTDQASVISELAETILPKTNTHGAKDLHIDRFIDRMISQVFSPEDQQLFLKGMDAFESEAKEVNGKSFIDSSPDQRTKLLTRMEQETAKAPGSVWGFGLKKEPGKLPFYRKVKELTLLGYFTAEETGKKILRYDPVPGQYLSDVPLSQVGVISFE
ncbi:MAG: gluconate 2-dehydrogenase subunit 3 family protein [Chitinophagaceae bacterium]